MQPFEDFWGFREKPKQGKPLSKSIIHDNVRGHRTWSCVRKQKENMHKNRSVGCSHLIQYEVYSTNYCYSQWQLVSNCNPLRVP